MSKVYGIAASVIAERINTIEEELEELREAYLKLGGSYEEEPEGEEAVKLLTGPKAKRKKKPAPPPVAGDADPDAFGVTIGGRFVKLASERQATVVEMLLAAGKGDVVKIDDIVGHYGGNKTRWYAEFGVINKKLEPASRVIANVRGLGYRLEVVA